MVNRRSSTVRRARTNELHELAALLAAAFHDDPVWGPTSSRIGAVDWRGSPGSLRGLRQFMPHQQVWTIEDLAGVTVWAPPGHWQVPPRELLGRAPSIARAFGRGLPRVLRATTMVENQHPGDLHYYLSYLGVAPARQGDGLGTALLRPVLDRCDSQGARPTWRRPQASATCLPLRRQGFEVREELDLPNGPRLWTMWREPGSG